MDDEYSVLYFVNIAIVEITYVISVANHRKSSSLRGPSSQRR